MNQEKFRIYLATIREHYKSLSGLMELERAQTKDKETKFVKTKYMYEHRGKVKFVDLLLHSLMRGVFD